MLRMIRLIITFGVVLACGIMLTVSGIGDKISRSKPRADISEITADEFKNGIFVSGTIYELWDAFAYMEESDETLGVKHNTRVTANYYAMPLEASFYGEDPEPKFVALAIRDPSVIKIADKMVDETNDYYIDGIKPETWTTLEISGKVTELSGDGLKFFKKYVEDQGFSAERTIVPFLINDGNDGGSSTSGLVMGIILTVVGLGGIAFALLRRALTGR